MQSSLEPIVFFKKLSRISILATIYEILILINSHGVCSFRRGVPENVGGPTGASGLHSRLRVRPERLAASDPAQRLSRVRRSTHGSQVKEVSISASR